MEQLVNEFMRFISASPTSYHAVEDISLQLSQEKFEKLEEENPWELKKGHRYFCKREGSLIAFIVPEKSIEQSLILASHTDSPGFKLKPHAEFIKEGFVMLGLEIYGSPLLSSWLNRDLGIAGKVLFENKKGKIQEALVNLREANVTIPQVAIHLDRKVNDEGLILNKQEHLNAIAGIHQGQLNILQTLLAKHLPIKELLTHELFLYPQEAPKRMGFHQEMLAAPRLDSLVSVHAILQAFMKARKPSPNTLQMIVFWDHEEIGSQSHSGAESPFFSNTIERILLNRGFGREDFLRLLNRSLCLSVDLGHAVHPNYPDKHDPQHKPLFGSGVLIKTNAQKRYATDIKSAKKIIEIARKEQISYYIFSSRNDIPSGTTIGPIQASLTGIPTVDIGIGQLSMHSIRELIAINDLHSLFHLLYASLITL